MPELHVIHGYMLNFLLWATPGNRSRLCEKLVALLKRHTEDGQWTTGQAR